MALCRDASMVEARRQLGLDRSSKVLVVVSEGVTDPASVASVVRER